MAAPLGERRHLLSAMVVMKWLLAVALLLAHWQAATAVEVLLFRGHEYRTRDGASPTSTTMGSEDTYSELPAGGWKLAPNTADARSVAGDTPGDGKWGTSVLVVSNGYAYDTNDNDEKPTQSYTNNFLRTLGEGSDARYAVRNCNHRNCRNVSLLLQRPCEGGTYHGTTKTVATEMDGAECSSCPTGKFAVNTGSSTCLDCDAGKYSGNTGSSACTNCDAGTFSADVGR